MVLWIQCLQLGQEQVRAKHCWLALYHSRSLAASSLWPTNHTMPSSTLPWTRLLPERAQAAGASSSLAQPQHCPPRALHSRDTRTSPASRVCHAVSSLHALAFARPSTWSALPGFPDSTPGAELSSPDLCPTVPLLRHLWLCGLLCHVPGPQSQG